MIVRTWHGAVPVEKACGFRAYLQNTGVKEALATQGNRGAFVHSQTQGEYEHFFMASYWVDMEAVRRFAGAEPHIAVTYPEDDDYGLISDPIVLHHVVSEIPSEFPYSL